MDLSDARWRGDLQRLIDTLARVPGLRLKQTSDKTETLATTPVAPKSGRKQLWLGMGLGVFGLIVLSLLVEGNKAADDSRAQSGVATQQQEPRVAQPVLQQVSPQQEVSNTAPSTPNVAGLWRSREGEIYVFKQEGRQVQMSTEFNGQAMGGGRGELDGMLLRLAMSFNINGKVHAANCDMQIAPDLASMTGQCTSRESTFAAQLFR